MRHRAQVSKRSVFFVSLSIAATVIGLLALVQLGHVSGASLLLSPLGAPSAPFGSPISTPLAPSLLVSPLATPVADGPNLSDAARSVLDVISQREEIPVDSIDVVADHPAQFAAPDQAYQVVTLVDTRPAGQVYKILVDLTTGRIEEDSSAVMDARLKAQQAHYGKLHPTLYERLQTMGDTEVVPVAVWIVAQPGQSLPELEAQVSADLAVKYPAVRTALDSSRKPMDVNDPELARRIHREYVGMIDTLIAARVVPVVGELERHGYAVTAYDGLPSIAADLPKSMIVSLSRRDDVGTIYLVDGYEYPTMDSAIPTDRVPEVWARGIDGTGINIAILENGNVDHNNDFIDLSPISRPSAIGIRHHTTRVASVAASSHDTYRGVAPGATIMSVGDDGTERDAASGLHWAFVNGAQVVNFSARLGGYDDLMNWSDRCFDYWARRTYQTVVVAAGNSGGSLGSPGKGWNVITVGATNDMDTPVWSDDEMRATSSWVNPVSIDREKPETVTVGGNVTTLSLANAIGTESGTSYAAPQVAGLAALLIARDSSLEFQAETIRAIIMATAIHNIEGPAIIEPGYGDLLDGAGAINADFADRLAQHRGSATAVCHSSCWWAHPISNSSFPLHSDLEREFYAAEGDLIRIAISWWSNPDGFETDCAEDRLDTDLDLRIKDPDDEHVLGASSVSFESNYEMTQFRAPKTGVYTIHVHKARADEPSNTLGVAFLRIPLPYRSYIPLAMSNYP